MYQAPPPAPVPKKPRTTASRFAWLPLVVGAGGIGDAIHTAILTLKEGFDGQISAENIEIGVVGADRKFNILTASEIADYLEEVE